MRFRNLCPKRRTDVPVSGDYQKYRPLLAEDFNHRCGYCNDWDSLRISNFEIDHFIPQKLVKNNAYSNLVYACHSCNNAKSAKWPSGDENIPVVGNVGWIDPCSEEYAQQFSRDDYGNIIPITPIGKWMYDNLKLGKTQHQYLWNIEQLDIICQEFEEKLKYNPDKKEMKDKLFECLLEYRRMTKQLFK